MENLYKDSKQFLLSSLIGRLEQGHLLARLCELEGSFDRGDLLRLSLLTTKAQTLLEELRTFVTIPVAGGIDVS